MIGTDNWRSRIAAGVETGEIKQLARGFARNQSNKKNQGEQLRKAMKTTNNK